MTSKIPAARLTAATGPANLMTVAQVLNELNVPRRSWQRWRELGTAPTCLRLPNGELRVKRADLDTWLESLGEAA